MENKFEVVLKEKNNKSVSTVQNLVSGTNETQNSQLSGSKTIHYIGIHESNNENSGSEIKGYPFKASEMKHL